MIVPFTEKILFKIIAAHFRHHDNKWEDFMEAYRSVDSMNQITISALFETDITPINNDHYELDLGMVISTFDKMYNNKQMFDEQIRLLDTVMTRYTPEQITNMKKVINELKSMTTYIHGECHCDDEDVARRALLVRIMQHIVQTSENA
jgi:hypothetical protein